MHLPEPVFVPSSDGVEVAAYDFGGDGPLLFLCHATGFCGGVWTELISHLVDTYRCVAIDLRAHGRTTVPENLDLAWTGMADDLLAVIDHFGDGSAVRAIGHSMGGATIVLAAKQRPDQFLRAWAFEPILFSPDKAEQASDGPSLVVGARKRRRNFESRDHAFERYGSRPPLSLFNTDVLHAYVDYGFADQADGSVELCCTPEHEAEVFEHALSGAYDAAGLVSFPFMVAASGDGMPPATMTYAAAAMYNQLTLAEYPALTHFGPLQDPEGLAVDVLAWFALEAD